MAAEDNGDGGSRRALSSSSAEGTTEELDIQAGYAIKAADWWYLLLLYVALHVIRAISVCICYPVLRRGVYGFDPKSACVLVYGGLRGAIGLALALIIMEDENIPEDTRRHCVFLMAGIAALTLVINGTTCRYLIGYLGLDRVSDAQKEIYGHICMDIENKLEEEAEAICHSTFFGDADWHLCWRYVPVPTFGVYQARLRDNRIVPDISERHDMRLLRDNPESLHRSWRLHRSLVVASDYPSLPPRLRRLWWQYHCTYAAQNKALAADVSAAELGAAAAAAAASVAASVASTLSLPADTVSGDATAATPPVTKMLAPLSPPVGGLKPLPVLGAARTENIAPSGSGLAPLPVLGGGPAAAKNAAAPPPPAGPPAAAPARAALSNSSSNGAVSAPKPSLGGARGRLERLKGRLDPASEARLAEARERLIASVQSAYQAAFQQGWLGSKSLRALRGNADSQLDFPERPLIAWAQLTNDYCTKLEDLQRWSNWAGDASTFLHGPRVWLSSFVIGGSLVHQLELVLNFRDAFAQASVSELVEEGPVKVKLAVEVLAQVDEANKMIKDLIL